ncbi:hypothetical protein BCS71_08080 [Vibrio lentus]|uniref:hypothetical protein n=1 Tax=Vibrio TaxID=662 RepID=UPI0002FFCD70|nr:MULTISPECIES: hypothetical protein [Vibrio]OCH56899.1 hypothetical protein A6E08_19550 [Vibrio lentus]PMH90433.1 hypothetical protein BCU56_17240 [Vibrio lentus]PMI60580.1 hypothetical protein BCU41_18875 [Vibrio lentus]
MSDVRKVASRLATANVFRTISKGPETQAEVVEQFKRMPDEQIDAIGMYGGVSKKHLPIYRKFARGEQNEFVSGLSTFKDCLQPGDIILVMGTAVTSKVLLKTQKRMYSKAKSSHVIVSQMDFICVDAVPKIGVSPRIVPDLLTNVEPDWRVIRCNSVTEDHYEKIMKSCAYYLEQPYRILPSKKPAKNFSYCSELARKIYTDSGIERSSIPKSAIIKPCDFDRIADENKNWSDVTSIVRPYIEFCIEYSDLLKIAAKPYIQGIDLNRERFKERNDLRKSTIKLKKKGKISKETASKIISEVNKTERSLNYQFWDHR